MHAEILRDLDQDQQGENLEDLEATWVAFLLVFKKKKKTKEIKQCHLENSILILRKEFTTLLVASLNLIPITITNSK
jgi:hypothetical protein